MRRLIDSSRFDKLRRARSPSHSGIVGPDDRQYISASFRFCTFMVRVTRKVAHRSFDIELKENKREFPNGQWVEGGIQVVFAHNPFLESRLRVVLEVVRSVFFKDMARMPNDNETRSA